jgi:GTP pyrophosphokinase
MKVGFPEKDLSLRSKAYGFAMVKHHGQVDDDNRDYLSAHILNVVRILSMVTDDDDIICAAYLHDTLEDTDTTLEELTENFGPVIADLVNEVTHDGTNDEHGYYFPRLHTKKAIMLKFADRLSNLSRMDSWNDKRQQQYLRKSKFWNDK